MMYNSVATWLFLAAFVSLGTTSSVELPTIKLIDCGQVPFPTSHQDYTQCLKISFSYLEEYAGLRGSETAMEGALLVDNDGSEKEDSRVSVTTERNSPIAFVMIADPADAELYKLEVNLETGEAKSQFLEVAMRFAEPKNNPEYKPSETVVSSRQAMPAKGFILRTQFICDSLCKKKLPNPQEAVDKIVIHANTFFSHGSLPTKIEVKAFPLKYYSGELVSSSPNMDILEQAVKSSNWPDADAYALLSYDASQSGSAGIANLAATCNKNREKRVSINEIVFSQPFTDVTVFNPIKTAQTVVHEIGHNFGMNHDFQGTVNVPRMSSKNEKCTGVGGYMDYYNEPNKWSPCSVEDFLKYYSFAQAQNGGCFCLAPKGGNKCTPKGVVPAFCADKETNCQAAQCTSGGLDYQEKCMDTCGMCPHGASTCMDHYSNCADLTSKNIGICEFGTRNFERDIRLKCRKTCNLCKKDPKQTPFPKTKCADKITGCQQAQCTSKYTFSVYNDNCRATCGYCPNEEGDCTDIYSNCGEIVAGDNMLCPYDKTERGQKYRLFCRKSCDTCVKVEVQPIMPTKCKDAQPNCQASQCSSSYKYQEKCLATCGNCRSGEATCRDYYSNCGNITDDLTCNVDRTEWASHMRVRCRKTCNLCA